MDKILCKDSTGCDEWGDYFVTEAEAMIDNAYDDDLDEF